MKINYVCFKPGVSLGIRAGNASSINAFDAVKLANIIEAEVTPTSVRFYPLVEGKRIGRQYTMPMSSIAYIDTTEDTPTTAKVK